MQCCKVQPYLLFIILIFSLHQAVYGVSPALHSPLMAVTNAISGKYALSKMHSSTVRARYIIIIYVSSYHKSLTLKIDLQCAN